MTAVPESVLTISITDPDWSYYARNAKGHVRRRTVQTLIRLGTPTLHSNPHLAMSALRIRHKTSPKVVATPLDFRNSLAKLLEILLILAAGTCTAMFPVAHWISATPTTPLWTYFSSSMWSHLNWLRRFATTKGNEARITT